MRILRYVIFYILLWIRNPFLFLANGLGIMLITFGLLLLTGDSNKDIGEWTPTLMIFSSFFLFVFSRRYDVLLLRINPDKDIDIIL